MIAAILRAQLLSMRLRAGHRGGPIFSAVTSAVFYGFWAFLAFAAMEYFAGADNLPDIRVVLPSALLGMLAYWQLSPVISAGFGSSLDLRKLLAWPIPRSQLFLIELLLRITTCAEMPIVLGGIAWGLLRNPGLTAAVRASAMCGGLLFAALNILLAAGVRSTVERVFRRSRVREFLVALIVIGAVAPQIAIFLRVRIATLLALVPAGLAWPWAAFAHLMLGETLLVSTLLVFVYVAGAGAFSRWQFERTLVLDPGSAAPDLTSEGRTGGAVVDAIFRLPGRFLPDPLGALVEKELRTLARIPRFRLVFAMSCLLGLVLYLPTIGQHRRTFFTENALPILSLYGLLMLGQISYWNSFGFDRSAAQGYFSWPIAFRWALIAKNITVALLLVPQILIIAVLVRLLKVNATWPQLVETMVVIPVASLYWLAVGNISSVRMPRAMDPDKMNQMSNKLQALTIWSAPLLLLPIGLAYWARGVLASTWIFAVLLVVAAAVGAVLYWVALDSAVRAALLTRENMLIELSRSEGPLASG